VGDDRDKVRLEVVARLVSGSCLTDDEVSGLLAKARDPAYWRALAPDLGVCERDSAEAFDGRPLDDPEFDDVLDYFDEEGYFHIESALSRDAILRLRSCVEILKRERWPLVFSFMYDEFWLAMRAPSVVRCLAGTLGPNYRLIPSAIWTYFVEPDKGAKGWPPHADNTGLTGRVNVWIPLSDATIDNGCIYLVPQSLAPAGFPEAFWERPTFTHEELTAVLQATRAVPARVGDVLGWHCQLIHWGSTCAREGDPRVSIAVQFIGADVEPDDLELPTFDLDARLPTLDERLHAIGKAMWMYQAFEPRMVRFLGLAERLVERQ
jgi:hypothetical protein